MTVGVRGVSFDSRVWSRMERFLKVLEINVLGLARTVAGSGGVWEMVEVVEEEEIEMEDGYEEEEEEKEARGIWMVLLFLALLVIVWTESDEVHLHQ